MVCEDTLKVNNLPKELADSEKEEFLKHFGATKVKVITSKAKQKSVVYARFESKEVAREVLFRLHQTYILKSRLCVEYAEHDIGLSKIKKVEQASSSNKESFKTFISKLNAFNHGVEFYQPPPAHLKYSYPKANRGTINNIGHALATVPKFYIQVLHLMNKMNLPPPFAVPQPVQKAQEQPTKPGSSSESEIESDEDSKKNCVTPQKRNLPQKKAIKRPKFIKPNAMGATSTRIDNPEEVFEKNEMQAPRRIEVKVATTTLEGRETEERASEVEAAPQAEEARTVIASEELAANQIPEKDLDVLPVFKNYHAGAPTSRLYIKNIAKSVEVKDLEYIFHRFKCTEEGKETFDIRLMQEGRMKGQGFVTLGSVEIAQKALKETNGYILKDKPLVVVFAKAAPKK